MAYTEFDFGDPAVSSSKLVRPAFTNGLLLIASALSLSSSVLESGIVATAYVGSVLASGGVSPYTYVLASGTLPAGLSLSASSGAITGTPTAAGTSTFTVSATDSDSETVSRSFSITIAAAGGSSGGGIYGWVQ